MKNDYNITVVVLTYNPVWEKLRATLKSIVEQQDVHLQVVITDDGSKNNYFDKVESYFKEIGFDDFKLISNKNNEGTVINLYRGIVASDAEYIKCISPGDLLYDRLTLAKWFGFTKEKNADITFCDAVFYNIKNGSLNIIKHAHNPRNMEIYLKPSSYHDKIINYIIFKDTISGAAILTRKKVLLYYISFLVKRVIYVEDFFMRLAVLDNKNIVYYPQKGIWYEFDDGGISTSGDSVWHERIRKDFIEMDKICNEKWDKHDETVQKWLLEYYTFDNNKESLWSKYTRYIRHPKWFYFRVYRSFCKTYSPVDVDRTFICSCFGKDCKEAD